MEYVLKVFKLDKRTKTGERFLSSYEFDRKDDAAMEREISELQQQTYPKSQFRLTFNPKYRTVTNMMSGKDVQIEWDTPHCCDPSTETYWCM